MTQLGKRLFYLFRHKYEVYPSLFEDHSIRRLRNRHDYRFLFEGFIPKTLLCWSVAFLLAIWERHKIEKKWDTTPGAFPDIKYPELYRPYVRDETKHLYLPTALNEEDLIVSLEKNREKLKTVAQVQQEKTTMLEKFKRTREFGKQPEE
ncbi:hypothetical protein C9374_002473 [Naegleria lovaniensis]|uniref:Uncharacterized protein n=1 Tax=Naegleria lovaniensis TaxID=51637 RepID=A0AA88GV55_NAELO|nr:uncharacterized protein C9374_002473 [Naegleria lovaniensis]KAG2386729.1 hypothetical protein C9374_002473 [Naegleria lovaniensis]